MKQVSAWTARAAVMAAGLALTPSVSLADDYTIGQPITQLLYDGAADYTYFIGPNRWGAQSCPNAYYAQVTASVQGRKQLLAIALAAKQSGATVVFQGTCGSHPNYFNVTYIILQ